MGDSSNVFGIAYTAVEKGGSSACVGRMVVSAAAVPPILVDRPPIRKQRQGSETTSIKKRREN
jgi:hypothetical protein